MYVSGRGSIINLSCLWKRQETAQLLSLPLCHDWYNTRDKDLTSSICLLLHSTLSHSPTPHPAHRFQSYANMHACCMFMPLCTRSFLFLCPRLFLHRAPLCCLLPFIDSSTSIIDFLTPPWQPGLDIQTPCSATVCLGQHSPGYLIHAQTFNGRRGEARPPLEDVFKPARV